MQKNFISTYRQRTITHQMVHYSVVKGFTSWLERLLYFIMVTGTKKHGIGLENITHSTCKHSSATMQLRFKVLIQLAKVASN